MKMSVGLNSALINHGWLTCGLEQQHRPLGMSIRTPIALSHVGGTSVGLHDALIMRDGAMGYWTI